MTPSGAALGAARRLPWLFRPLLRAALSVYPYRRGGVHWVVLKMKEDLGIRLSIPMQVDGFTIEADPYDGPGHTFWRSGLTEPETRRLLTTILRPGMIMLDVGAYVGQFTLVASRTGAGGVRVIAIEPTPAVFRQLLRNIEVNRCSNVTCVQAALSDKPGRAKFFFFPQSNDQNSLRPLADPRASAVEVAVETIDSIADANKLDHLNVIKVDVEGNELAVLRGARQTLLRFKPILIIEISRHQRAYGYAGADIKNFLTELGYRVHRIEHDSYPPYVPTDDDCKTLSHFNILAMAEDKGEPLFDSKLSQ